MLILGTVASVVTMILHPTHFSAVASTEAMTRQIRVLLALHALALLSIPVVVFGLFGITQRIGWERPESRFAFIVYCLSTVAVMLAAMADGIINAALIPKILSADESVRQPLKAALKYNFQIKACAKVFAFGTSLAIISWSIAIVRAGPFERVIGMGGFFVGVTALAGLLSGHIRMDPHGFGLVILLQAFWMAAVGVPMLRASREKRSKSGFS